MNITHRDRSHVTCVLRPRSRDSPLRFASATFRRLPHAQSVLGLSPRQGLSWHYTSASCASRRLAAADRCWPLGVVVDAGRGQAPPGPTCSPLTRKQSWNALESEPRLLSGFGGCRPRLPAPLAFSLGKQAVRIPVRASVTAGSAASGEGGPAVGVGTGQDFPGWGGEDAHVGLTKVTSFSSR